MADQRYVSAELSHFVGQHDRNDHEAQYQLLLKILSERKLATRHSDMGSSYFRGVPLFTEDGQERRYRQSAICFCDIPEPDLAIHTAKYGCFGLAFTKAFLIQHRARPVFYVPTTTTGFGNNPDGPPATLADLFNSFVARLDRVQQAMHTRDLAGVARSEVDKDTNWVLHNFLEEQCLRFIKGFNPTAEDDDPHNVYMEREWRIADVSLEFTLADVHRVFMPSDFASRFRDDVPEYANQLSFVPA